MILNKQSKFRRNVELEKVLLSKYFKKDFKSGRAYICIYLSFIPTLSAYFFILGINNWDNNITQIIIDKDIFWGSFLGQLTQFGPLISLILAFNLINGDFSSNTAMILYSTISRRKYLISNIISLLLHLMFLEFISFVSFGILSLLLLNITVSVNIIVMGFIFGFVHLSFMLAFAFMISTFSRNTVISLLLPILYLWIMEPIFYQLEMELLSFNFYSRIILDIIQNVFFDSHYIIDPNLVIFGPLMFFSLSTIIFLISIHGFQLQDIKTS